MEFYKKQFSGGLSIILVLLSLSVQSCAVVHKSIPGIVTSNEQSFKWRIEIKLQLNNNDVYNVLAVLGSNAQPISSSQFNHFPEKALPGTIIVYITATNDQADQLRQSLLESGALAVFENKSNSN